ncbi:MAG: PIG-L family deacetylase [Elusimicrobia bacterium]|nr:PIG-L family deacetylase [Elusimicrobiota bacterium]
MKSNRTILAIGAHPDDLEFGCGGLLRLLTKRGWSAHLLVMTGGEQGGSAPVRRHEQEHSADFMRAELHWGGFNDTELPPDRTLIKTIDRHVQAIKPDILLSHYWDDTHQDHRAVAQAAITAGRHLQNMLFYEGPSTLNFKPGIYADISSAINDKLKLLKLHASQVNKTRVPHLSILESAKSVAIYRGNQNKCKYAEAFQTGRLSLDFLVGL